jgi:seryl-tRNA synthetase
MLDITLIRENPELVKKGIAAKNEKGDAELVLKIDEERRALIFKTEELKKQRNENSKLVSVYKKEGKDASEVIQSTKQISQQIKELDEKLSALESELHSLLSRIPNMPHRDTPIGKDETAGIHPKKGHFTHYGHEHVSAKLVIYSKRCSSAKINFKRFILFSKKNT